MQPTLAFPGLCFALAGWLAGAHLGLGASPGFLAWAKTPPMGWNSWDCFGAGVWESNVLANADYLARHLKSHGWDIVTIDIQWYEPLAHTTEYRPGAALEMDAHGRLLPAPNRFPLTRDSRSFKPIADRLHAQGLKFGLHLLRGIPRQAVARNVPILGTAARAADIADTNSLCRWNTDMFGVDMSKPGAQDYYDSVFALLASWEVDLVKVDDLSAPNYHQAEVEAIRKAIDKSGRPIVLSTSPGETPLSAGRHVAAHANMWRISNDFWDDWRALFAQFQRLHAWTPLRGPGHWPDADMLPLGNVRAWQSQDAWTRFTRDEQYTLMTLWCIARSPLILGGNLPNNDAFTLSLLTNDEVLSVNQASLNNRQVFNRSNHIAWVADVPESNDKYLALFNVAPVPGARRRDRTQGAQPAPAQAPDGPAGSGPATISVPLADIGLTGPCTVRDLWARQDLGAASNSVTAQVNSHGAVLLRVQPNARAGQGAPAAPGTGHSSTPQSNAPSPRAEISLDADWHFRLGDWPGAELPRFDASAWRSLSVPHDWSIAGPFAETNRTGGAGGFLPAGVGWYRKTFTLPALYSSRRVFVEFDGVMANSDVWINGFHLGHRPYGYVGFRYELSGHLHFGNDQANFLAVRADNSAQPASRWYTGAGIYRHVRLVVTDPVHLDPWGPFVTTSQVTSNAARIHIQTTVLNQSDAPSEAVVESTLLAPDGRPVLNAVSSPQQLAPGQPALFQQELSLKNPQLWQVVAPLPQRSLLDPALCATRSQPLYRLSTKVRSGGTTRDEALTAFGVREARFEPATGFWLNGQNLKLNGVCLHHEAGALGAAVPLRAWERRLQLLRQAGCNAIRTAHNPPAPEFLDLCDRLGFLVMDELFDCWTVGKNRYDYHLFFEEWSKQDLRDTVCRDRNHPSVILYSAGNEIRDTPKAELAKTILRGLVAAFHDADPTRPVTQALFRPNASHDYDNGLADLLDVVGQNYRENELLAAHQAQPQRRILGTENGHDRKVWLALRDQPPCAGQFLWTGFDYLGESRRWPVVGAGSGLFDRTGNPRPRAFQRQSWWSDQPMVYIVRRLQPDRATPADPGFEPLTRLAQELPDWTPRNSAPHEQDIEVYSNCEQVELQLNGRSLGSQPLPADASPRAWKVPYEPGSLQALGKNHSQVVATCELRSAGTPAQIRLQTDRPQLTPDWDDVSYVTATVVDANGVPVPDASDLITFELSGPGLIAAVDSGDNASHEPFQANSRHAYLGRCIAILRATASSGRITLRASAPGRTPAAITLEAAGKAQPPSI